MSTSAAPPPPLPDIFQDLESRFLLNLPDSELSSFPRLFFQLQQAHWFYCDFYHDRWPQLLPAYHNLKVFCTKFFTLSPLLSSQLSRFDGLYDSFTSYLHSVPVCGVILLNARLDRVLMVRGWKGNSWSFPKGKIDANEGELQCALRECREEVGYEVSGGDVGQDDWIEAAVSGKSVKLFLVAGVDEGYSFETRTRKEISGIEWVDVAALPSYRDGRAGGVGGGGGAEEDRRKKFWNVMPFVDELRRWIGNKRKGGGGKPNQRRNNNKQLQQSVKSIKPPPSQPIAIQPSSSSLSVASPVHALSSSVPTATVSHPHRPSSSPSRQSIDDSNALTFAASAGGALAAKGGGETSGRWSAEEMFALNEAKYGVRSSVVEEKLEVPANIDEIMRSVLGPRYRGGGGGGRGGSRGEKDRGGGKHRSARSEQLTNHPSAQSPFSTPPLPPLPEQSTLAAPAGAQQSSARGRGFRGRGRGHNHRNTSPLPAAPESTAMPAAPLNVEELDFSHNPYQPRTLAVSVTPTTASASASAHPVAPHSSSALPSPASFDQLAAKSAATPITQPQAVAGGAGVSAAPYSARVSASRAGSGVGGKFAASPFSDFSFDLDSILQPLSASQLE